MRDTNIGHLFRVQPRFLRSAQLERDFEDVNALDGYVLTPQLSDHLERIFAGLAPNSGQRAWRITGDYGVGKSSFALLLTHFLSGQGTALPRPLKAALGDKGARQPLMPVLVTGSREPVAQALLRALKRSLEQLGIRRGKLCERINTLLTGLRAHVDRDDAVIQVIRDAAALLKSQNHSSGLLIVLDELGKFLEYAAHSPDRQDVYFLQLLGEAASRSRDTPIIVVGLLHQGFGAYADRLADPVQREWQKVAGRFEELLFDRPLEQTARLIAEAVNLRVDELPRGALSRARDGMAETIALGWYGAVAKDGGLNALAPRLYPLHATVLPALTRLFARFGQNERSLFSFLLSSEPFALQAFSANRAGPDTFYRLSDLYDYARAVFGSRLGAQSYRTHWNLLESIVESFSADQPMEADVLKTVAMLNLIDDQGLLATPEALELALGLDEHGRRRVRDSVKRLQKMRVLHYRGASGSFCLWPHTSVNVERVYAEAMKAVPSVGRVTESIAKDLDTRPLVARRHYIETGNLRHFEVRYLGMSDLQKDLIPARSDGTVLVPLCETVADHAEALAFARSTRSDHPAILVAVPRPLETLRSMVLEAQRWQWVLDNTPELANDRYAMEEVSRQLADSRQVLNGRLQSVFGVRGSAVRSELQWFHAGQEIDIGSNRELLSALSRICDAVYSDAPRIRNELINRRELSSAAAAARMRLIENLLENPSVSLLGMDEAKRPPEMSMYLSVLHAGQMHVRSGDSWSVAEPPPRKDPSNVRPVFARITQLLRTERDVRVRISAILEALRPAPLGVREGLAPLLLAVYTVAHYDSLAFYEDGNFLPSISGQDFMRIIKAPASFEIQLCEVTGVRAEVFAQLASLLQPTSKAPATTLLDVVRALCSFAAELPKFTHVTKQLSESALQVRDVLLGAREPGLLVFRELPGALGFPEFGERGERTRDTVTKFVRALRATLDELRGRYAVLLQELESMLDSLEQPARHKAREQVASAAERLSLRVHEPRLRGFCLRLSDRNLPHDRWIEAIASFVTGKPPALWSDRDVAAFRDGLGQLTDVYRRVEATSLPSNDTASDAYIARLAVTLQDGSDAAYVVQMRPDQAVEVAVLEARFSALLDGSSGLGLVAATRALWGALEREHPPLKPVGPSTT